LQSDRTIPVQGLFHVYAKRAAAASGVVRLCATAGPASDRAERNLTGCFDTPYFEILDLRRFIVEYCLEWADTIVRKSKAGDTTAKGFCGNIWFQKQGCQKKISTGFHTCVAGIFTESRL